MIDRHYGHLARDGREHAICPVDELSAGRDWLENAQFEAEPLLGNRG